MGDVEHSCLGPPCCVNQDGNCLRWYPPRVGEQGQDVQLGAGQLLHEKMMTMKFRRVVKRQRSMLGLKRSRGQATPQHN